MVVKHHTLSLLLYMHLHGLKATQRWSAIFYALSR